MFLRLLCVGILLIIVGSFVSSPRATAQSELACTSAPESQIQIGNSIVVNETNGRQLQLRAAPSSDGIVVADFSVGTRLSVVDGPLCGESNNLYLWWQVTTPDGQSGWIPEGDAFFDPPIYFVVPLAENIQPESVTSQTNTITTSPIAAESQTTQATETTAQVQNSTTIQNSGIPLECVAAPPSYAQIGQTVTVRDNAGRPLRLRDEPSTLAPFTAELFPGSSMTIIDGPRCGTRNNLYLWWQVTTADGQTGWIAEGDSFQKPFLYFISAPETEADIAVLATSSTCFAAPPSKIQIGEVVVVGENGGIPLRMRSGPSTYGRVLRELKTGEIMIVEEGPFCGEANNYYAWWQIRLQDGTTGWVAEGDATQNPIIYFITPFSEVLALQTGASAVCRAAPDPKLQVGGAAIIGENGGYVLRVRDLPSTKGRVIDNLNTGEIVKVLDGPRCGEQNNLYRWWQIELPDGRIGWVADGDSFQTPDIYFLEPLGAQG